MSESQTRINSESPHHNKLPSDTESNQLTHTYRTHDSRMKKTYESLRPVRQQREFLLDGEKMNMNFLQYNSLKDRHLQNYFSNKKLRKLLCDNGLITKEGRVVEKITSFNKIEKLKAAEKDKGLIYQTTERGTVISSVQLPSITDTPQMRARSLESGSQTHRHQKPRSFVHGIFPITPSLPQTESYKSLNKQPVKKTSQKQFLYLRTPVEALKDFDFTERRGTIDSSSSPRKRSARTTQSSVNLHTNLKPLSKEELHNIFEKYKNKVNKHDSVVEEVSEACENTVIEADNTNETKTSRENKHKRVKSTFSENKANYSPKKPSQLSQSSYKKKPLLIKISESDKNFAKMMNPLSSKSHTDRPTFKKSPKESGSVQLSKDYKRVEDSWLQGEKTQRSEIVNENQNSNGGLEGKEQNEKSVNLASSQNQRVSEHFNPLRGSLQENLHKFDQTIQISKDITKSEIDDQQK